MGLLIKWIKNSNGEVTKKIHENAIQHCKLFMTIIKTKIEEKSPLRFYIQASKHSAWCPNFSPFYPAHYLARR